MGDELEALDATDAREVGYMLAVGKTRLLLLFTTRRAASFRRWMRGLCWAEDDRCAGRCWAMPEGRSSWLSAYTSEIDRENERMGNQNVVLQHGPSVCVVVVAVVDAVESVVVVVGVLWVGVVVE